MRSSTIVSIVFFMLLGLVTGITLYLNMFDAYTFWGSIFYILFMIAGGITIYYWWMNSQKKNLETKTIEYCWNRAAALLQRMPGGASIEWDKGFNRRSQIKYYFDGIKKHQFRSFKATTVETNQPVVVIFDLDKEDIAEYYSSPSPEVFRNHFFGFDPFNQKGSGMGGNQPYNRNGQSNMNGRSVSIHLPVDGDGGQQRMGDDDYAGAANKAINTLNR